MAVFHQERKTWKLQSLKPIEQAKKEAENPEKYRAYRQPKVKKSELSKNTPQERLSIARETEQQRLEKDGPDEKAEREKAKAEKLQAFEAEKQAAKQKIEQGDKFKDRPRQRNEGKIEFFLDDKNTHVVLELAVPKYLDTSAIDIDIQPTWLAVIIKGKEFLIHLPEEVNIDASKAERSQGTGALVLTMPFMNEVIKAPELEDRESNLTSVPKPRRPAPTSTDLSDEAIGKTKATVNLNVVQANEAEVETMRQKRQDDLSKAWAPKPKKNHANKGPKTVSPNFVDNSDVPPLE